MNLLSGFLVPVTWFPQWLLDLPVPHRSHDMSDVQRLCRRVLVVDDGAIAFDGPLSGLAEVAEAGRTMVVDLATPVCSAGELPLPVVCCGPAGRDLRDCGSGGSVPARAGHRTPGAAALHLGALSSFAATSGCRGIRRKNFQHTVTFELGAAM
ncbi:hypothetical protein [Pseudarthrobacter sp. N5]|uniref:hypothetical protein n=1 Tax=Pseudarthrobacter sp. N5 TaxID=3418416 RepID=UPI003CEFC589